LTFTRESESATVCRKEVKKRATRKRYEIKFSLFSSVIF
ncbi:MAG: hypothetical protein ACI96G_001061, partial [Flavobacterium sp.]